MLAGWQLAGACSLLPSNQRPGIDGWISGLLDPLVTCAKYKRGRDNIINPPTFLHSRVSIFNALARATEKGEEKESAGRHLVLHARTHAGVWLLHLFFSLPHGMGKGACRRRRRQRCRFAQESWSQCAHGRGDRVALACDADAHGSARRQGVARARPAIGEMKNGTRRCTLVAGW